MAHALRERAYHGGKEQCVLVVGACERLLHYLKSQEAERDVDTDNHKAPCVFLSYLVCVLSVTVLGPGTGILEAKCLNSNLGISLL